MEKKSEIVDTKIDKNQIKINVNNLENNIQKNKEAKGVNSEKISKKEQDKKSNGNHRKMDANKILEKMNQDEEKKLRNLYKKKIDMKVLMIMLSMKVY